MNIDGIAFVASALMVDHVQRQYRFPRSKKRRIRKKWAKRRSNYKTVAVPQTDVYRVGSTIVAHPEIIDRIRAECTRRMNVPARLVAPDCNPSYSSARLHPMGWPLR